MSEFEKAFNQLSKVSLENHTEVWGEPKTERAFFEAGQASKQAEIDGLKTQLNNMEACYIEKKKQVEELQKRIDEYKKLTTSIRNEFDLWSDDSEFADVIEAQIENLEALRGEHE